MTPDDAARSGHRADAPTADDPPEGASAGADDEATLGMDDVLGREVGLVTLPPVSGPAHGNRVDRIRRLARLHHPHLIEVYDVDGLDGDSEHVLVLESVAGEPLDQLLAAGPMPAERVAEIGARVASGLAHAHHHGVVHGRLGPASVLVEDDRHVWLVGLTASLQEDSPSAGTVAAPTPADDLRALARTLSAAVEPAGADELAAVLADAREGTGTAGALCDQLFRFARRDGEAPTTRFALLVQTPRPDPGRPPVAADATVPHGGVVGTGLGARARLGTLAAVALLLALTSGLVIWGQEARGWFGASNADVATPVGPPGPAPAPPLLPVAVPDGGSATSSQRSSDAADSGSGASPPRRRATPSASASPVPAVPAPLAGSPTRRSVPPPAAPPTPTAPLPDATPPPTLTVPNPTVPTLPPVTSTPTPSFSAPPSAGSSPSSTGRPPAPAPLREPAAQA